jgi:hypothetical protein
MRKRNHLQLDLFNELEAEIQWRPRNLWAVISLTLGTNCYFVGKLKKSEKVPITTRFTVNAKPKISNGISQCYLISASDLTQRFKISQMMTFALSRHNRSFLLG